MTLNRQQFNEEQLPMFMTAREIKERYQPSDFTGMIGNEPEWRGKLRESKYEDPYMSQTTYESIRQHGVRRPVRLYISNKMAEEKRYLGQGHHRVAAQFDIDPDRLMPVKFTGSFSESIDEDPDEFQTRW